MTSIQRAMSLAILLLSSTLLNACSLRVSNEVEGCPPAHVHLDLHGAINDGAGNEIDGRAYVLTVAAQSYDPEYLGIYVVGTGLSGHTPVTRDMSTEADTPDEEPVLCIPAERAVAVMVRMAMQHPAAAYELIECQLVDKGVDGLGGTGPVASDSREVELTDLIERSDDYWYVAQCDWIYVPPGFAGQMPDLFPRPDHE